MSEGKSKDELRTLLAERVMAIARARREVFDREIVVRVCECEAYRSAEQVLAYRALGDEVDLETLFTRAIAEGKSIWLPVVGRDAALEFRAWRPGEPLARSSLGVEEPRDERVPEQRPTIVLVPGRGFDRRGYRLGRGRGCYDRFLGSWARLGPTVGVGYSCQVLDRLPVAVHDRPVDMIVTEQGLLLPVRP